jgi:hypothetical protein
MIVDAVLRDVNSSDAARDWRYRVNPKELAVSS